jgi:hypothetical protein
MKTPEKPREPKENKLRHPAYARRMADGVRMAIYHLRALVAELEDDRLWEENRRQRARRSRMVARMTWRNCAKCGAPPPLNIHRLCSECQA